MISQEQRLQEQFAMWLDSIGVLHCASLGGVNLPMRYAVKMKRKGYKRGFPDHLILEPCGSWHGLFVELKVNNIKKDENQDHWCKELVLRGYRYIRVPGKLDFFEARKWLESEVNKYLKGEA